MLAWSVAKLQGRTRTRSNRKGHANHQAGCFLAELANVASARLTAFAPQGLSNIAWALATVDVLDEDDARHFMTAAAMSAVPRLAKFPPQAIANLCWAFGQMPGEATSGSCSRRNITNMAPDAFAEAAAQQAMQRISEFSWQDLSSVIVALSHGRHRNATTNQLATQLVIRATNSCHALSTQVMLNIALSATRLGVQQNVLKPLVIQIGRFIAAHPARASPKDWQQWAEVQTRCTSLNLSSQDCGFNPQNFSCRWQS